MSYSCPNCIDLKINPIPTPKITIAVIAIVKITQRVTFGIRTSCMVVSDKLMKSNKSAQQELVVKCVQHLILKLSEKFLLVTTFLQNEQVVREQVDIFEAKTEQKIDKTKIQLTLIFIYNVKKVILIFSTESFRIYKCLAKQEN